MITTTQVYEGGRYIVRNKIEKDVASVLFEIEEFSSQDPPKFIAKNLLANKETESGRNGWATARLCKYPQHLSLRLLDDIPLMNLWKIDLLVHRHKQPTKIDVHVSLGDNIFHHIG